MEKYKYILGIVFVMLTLVSCAGGRTQFDTRTDGAPVFESNFFGLFHQSSPTEMSKAYERQKRADWLSNIKTDGKSEQQYIGVVINIDHKRTMIFFPPENSGQVEIPPGEAYFMKTSSIPKHFYVTHKGLDKTDEVKVFPGKFTFDNVACDYWSKIDFRY
jgi:hypothetical protein